jgi:hypothetical protein
MNIKFTKIQNATERKKVQELYNQSVPAHEKAYFYLLWWKRSRPNISFVNIYDGDKWVGFVFYSIYKDLVYVWFFATCDTTTSKEYDSAMFAEIKRLYPDRRIAVSIESENENADNAEQSANEQQFYENNGFKETGYFVKRKADSFKIMIIGKSFNIEELCNVNKAVYPLIGRFLAADLRKQIQRK